jgi:DNA-directed RNA polymerase subunit F
MLSDSSFEIISITRVKKLLEDDEKRMELSYEKKLALEHAKTFSKINLTNTDKLVKELLNDDICKDKMTGTIALKIAEHLPRNANELRPFFAKERYTLENNEIEKILSIVKKYSD